MKCKSSHKQNKNAAVILAERPAKFKITVNKLIFTWTFLGDFSGSCRNFNLNHEFEGVHSWIIMKLKFRSVFIDLQ